MRKMIMALAVFAAVAINVNASRAQAPESPAPIESGPVLLQVVVDHPQAPKGGGQVLSGEVKLNEEQKGRLKKWLDDHVMEEVEAASDVFEMIIERTEHGFRAVSRKGKSLTQELRNRGVPIKEAMLTEEAAIRRIRSVKGAGIVKLILVASSITTDQALEKLEKPAAPSRYTAAKPATISPTGRTFESTSVDSLP